MAAAVLAADDRRVDVVRRVGGETGGSSSAAGRSSGVSSNAVDTLGSSWRSCEYTCAWRGSGAGGHERAAELLRAGGAHASQLGEDHGQRPLHRHLELEPVGDHAAVPFDVDKPHRRRAVGVRQRAPLGAIEIGDDGHGEHSPRRARS